MVDYLHPEMPADISKGPGPTGFVGARIRARFERPAAWFWGTITSARRKMAGWNLEVAYDDGTKESVFYKPSYENLVVDRPLHDGDLIFIEYTGEGEFLCRL